MCVFVLGKFVFGSCLCAYLESVIDRVGGRGGGNLNLIAFPLRFCDDLASK